MSFVPVFVPVFATFANQALSKYESRPQATGRRRVGAAVTTAVVTRTDGTVAWACAPSRVLSFASRSMEVWLGSALLGWLGCHER